MSIDAKFGIAELAEHETNEKLQLRIFSTLLKNFLLQLYCYDVLQWSAKRFLLW
jgi:hypothetical protein